MKNIIRTLLILTLLFWTKDAIACGENISEIEHACFCIESCEPSEKCSWVYQIAHSLKYSPKDKLEKQFVNFNEKDKENYLLLKQMAPLHLEILDMGYGGCFTMFGEIEEALYRVDFLYDFSKLESNIISVSSRSFEINKYFTFAERKASLDVYENTCIELL